MNVLFICSRNQWRSPTAEQIFQNVAGHRFRSAGTSGSARIKVSAKLLERADLVLVMEKKHKQMLLSRFGGLAQDKDTQVLDIPDEYPYMDEELVDILEAVVPPYL